MVSRFLARRVALGLAVIVTATLIAWLLVYALGSPANLMLPISATPQQVARFSHQMGFDKPLPERLGHFVVRALHGDFGISYWQNQSASRVVVSRLPAELVLIGGAMLVAYVLSLVLGVLAARRAGGALDRLIVAGSMVGVSMPAFWLAELLVVAFAVRFRWFPVGGYGTFRAAVLPVLATAALPLGRLTQIVRSSVLDEQTNRVHITSLRARGVPERRIIFVHAVRNASAAIVTMGGWEIGRLLAGFTVTIEVVFGWPGLGHLAVDAIQQRDLPLIVADVFFVSTALVVLNIVVDLARVLLDRRIVL
jgi:peptide/nickel transport system permease protein